MTDNIENHTLELLKAIQADQVTLKNAIIALHKELHNGLTELNRANIRIEQDLLLLRADNVDAKERMERVELRLNLADLP